MLRWVLLFVVLNAVLAGSACAQDAEIKSGVWSWRGEAPGLEGGSATGDDLSGALPGRRSTIHPLYFDGKLDFASTNPDQPLNMEMEQGAARMGGMTPAEVAEQYWFWWLVSGAVLLMLAGGTLWGRRMVAARNAELNRVNRSLQREIDARAQTEDSLRESQRLFATLMSNLPGVVYRCNNDRQRSLLFVSEGSRH